jgi:hypothetical protein
LIGFFQGETKGMIVSHPLSLLHPIADMPLLAAGGRRAGKVSDPVRMNHGLFSFKVFRTAFNPTASLFLRIPFFHTVEYIRNMPDDLRHLGARDPDLPPVRQGG